MLQAYRDTKNQVCGKDLIPLKVVTASIKNSEEMKIPNYWGWRTTVSSQILSWRINYMTRFDIQDFVFAVHIVQIQDTFYPFYILITLHNITEISSLFRIGNRIMYPYLYRIDVLIISKLLLANFFRCQLYTIKNKYI